MKQPNVSDAEFLASVKSAPRVSRAAEREILAWCHAHPKDKRLKTVMIPRWCRKFNCGWFSIENVFWREAAARARRETQTHFRRVRGHLQRMRTEGQISAKEHRSYLALLKRSMLRGEA